MSKIHVTGIPVVNIRCQFETVPGVTHISLEYDPHSRGNRINGKIDCSYGNFILNDQVINGALQGYQAGSLFILKKTTFNEFAEAITAGIETLRKMYKASNHVPYSD